MSPELKSLIEASVVNGQVDEQAKKVILAKAAQQGISEDECVIYISSVIRSHEGQQKAIKAEVNYRAYVLIFSGVFDFLYGASIADVKMAQDIAAFCMLSGIALILFGFHLLGKNIGHVLRRIGWVIIAFLIAGMPLMWLQRFLSSVLPFTKNGLALKLFLITTWIAIFIAIALLRSKIFGTAMLQKFPFLNKVSAPIDNIRKKTIKSKAANDFIETDITPGIFDIFNKTAN
jgi:hypothetical protein